MLILANIVVGLIALFHVYILALEMFLWDKPAGIRAFNQTQEAATASKVLAANQGLYNGFLAAGLFWGLGLGAAGMGVKVFFLFCGDCSKDTEWFMLAGNSSVICCQIRCNWPIGSDVSAPILVPPATMLQSRFVC